MQFVPHFCWMNTYKRQILYIFTEGCVRKPTLFFFLLWIFTWKSDMAVCLFQSEPFIAFQPGCGFGFNMFLVKCSLKAVNNIWTVSSGQFGAPLRLVETCCYCSYTNLYSWTIAQLINGCKYLLQSVHSVYLTMHDGGSHWKLFL